MKYASAVFGFAEELVPLVKNGTKTLTYRLGQKYAFLKHGDELLVEDSSTHHPFAKIEIVSTSETRFADLPLDRTGHESYASKAEQQKIFEQFYQRPILADEPALIIEFKVLRLL